MVNEWNMSMELERCWYYSDRGKRTYQSAYPGVAFSTTVPTWNDLASNGPVFGEGSATDRLTSATVWIYVKTSISKQMFMTCNIHGSQRPRGLRRRSAAERLLKSWVRIPPGAWMFFACECLCCQVEVSVTSSRSCVASTKCKTSGCVTFRSPCITPLLIT
jgi:hypothetical protein